MEPWKTYTPAEQRERNIRAKVRAAFLRVCCLFPGKVRVRISYTSQKNDTSTRVIKPLKIEHNVSTCRCGRKLFRDAMKCRAWCETKQDERLFFPSQMKIHQVIFGRFM